MKKILPKEELKDLAEWCKTHEGGFREYLEETRLKKWV